MSIYSLYEDTYKKLDNEITIAKFLTNSQIMAFRTCCDTCKSINANIASLSLEEEKKSNIYKIKISAYKEFFYIINDFIYNENIFNTLGDQLSNYNIKFDSNTFEIFNVDNLFKISFANSNVNGFYNFAEISNIIDIPISKFTIHIYNCIYGNKHISDIFDKFKDINNAGIRITKNNFVAYQDINYKDIYINIAYKKFDMFERI